MSEFGVSCLSGSFSQPHCVMNGTIAASAMNATTMTMPSTAALLRTSRYQASCHSERCLRTRTLSSAARSAAVCCRGAVTVATSSPRYWSHHWWRQAVWADDTKCRMTTLLGDLDARIQEAVHEVDGERSEEHTSELQSRGHLVCRLLLEKKKETAWAVQVYGMMA